MSIGFSLGLATIAGIVFAVAYWYRDPINVDTSAMVQAGMTEVDVNEILGRSCDDSLPYQNSGTWRRWQDEGSYCRWNGTFGSICVNLDNDGIVTQVWFEEKEATTFQKIRRWLGIDPDPSHLTPYRIHGGVGPASSSI
jgi:hypothetical protein